jgi:transposase
MARPRSYPDEFRERAVRLVREWRAERGLSDGGLTVVAAKLGLHRETLRRWVLEQEADGNARPGLSRGERSRIAELERENKELRRANEILKTGGCRTGRRVARQSDPAAPVLTSRCFRGGPWLRRSRVRPPELEQVVGGGDQLPLAVDGREPSS